LIVGSIYALVALGYTMVYGILQLINFAHGDIVMVGAVVALIATKALMSLMPGMPGPLVLALAALVAVAACVPLSILIERLAYRPLRK
ncbi:ABC transporter permease subunit, partial [Streptococcus pyogenes]|uniref:ABC transporter permease subunit n=1 Tax=Streptococcus pyogenes TaxID=1314 RepID=UPI003DA1093B